MPATKRKVRVFRYDPAVGGDGGFQDFDLEIPNESATTMLDVLLRLQKEQDPTIAFRFACRVNMCGSCGMVINGRERLACKTNCIGSPRGRDHASADEPLPGHQGPGRGHGSAVQEIPADAVVL